MSCGMASAQHEWEAIRSDETRTKLYPFWDAERVDQVSNVWTNESNESIDFVPDLAGQLLGVLLQQTSLEDSRLWP